MASLAQPKHLLTQALVERQLTMPRSLCTSARHHHRSSACTTAHTQRHACLALLPPFLPPQELVKEMVEEDLVLARRDQHSVGGGFQTYSSTAH